ncbi:hypothetical protein VP01_712g2 [Puccinia sorghi]|uniref:Uncharacterized protein n=1 Tax=Puccinia sorghi TaxID=27349 RepID=A0A0L6UDH4_9BASI|nr:hypothetical protein VP01_712g2 [Puccinia sorghi]
MAQMALNSGPLLHVVFLSVPIRNTTSPGSEPIALRLALLESLSLLILVPEHTLLLIFSSSLFTTSFLSVSWRLPTPALDRKDALISALVVSTTIITSVVVYFPLPHCAVPHRCGLIFVLQCQKHIAQVFLHAAFSSQAVIQTPPVCICSCFGTVILHQSLVESLLEKGWSNNISFLGVSASQLQAVDQVFFAVYSYMHRKIITRGGSYCIKRGGSIILQGEEVIILQEEEVSYYKRRKYCIKRGGSYHITRGGSYHITRGGIYIITRGGRHHYVLGKDGGDIHYKREEGSMGIEAQTPKSWQYMQVHAGLHSLYCIMHGIFGGNGEAEQKHKQSHVGLHSLYCIRHGIFGGSVWTVQQYMKRHAWLLSLYCCAWNVWVSTCGQHSNICKWGMCRQDPLKNCSGKEFPVARPDYPLHRILRGACPGLPVINVSSSSFSPVRVSGSDDKQHQATELNQFRSLMSPVIRCLLIGLQQHISRQLIIKKIVPTSLSLWFQY